MKSFVVVSRSPNGVKQETVFEAADRTALFALLQEKGISAISVREGTRTSAPRRPLPSSARGLIAGLSLVGIVGAAYFLFIANPTPAVPDGESLPQATRSKTTKSDLTSLPTTAAPAATSFAPSVSSPTRAATGVTTEMKPQEAQITNDTATIKRRKPVFTNPMDQLMSMVMPHEPGDSVPPVPISDDMEFTEEQEKQMFERLTAEADDSEEILARKELVQAMRNEYTELKKRGWTFVDYIKALESKAQIDNEVLTESWKIHETLFNNANISDADYLSALEKINKVLGERGIKPIKPPTVEDDEETEPAP